MSRALLTAVRERRDAKQRELEGLVAKVDREKRTHLSADESARFEELRSTIDALDAREAELVEEARREDNAVEARRLSGVTTAQIRGGADTYVPHGEHSFLRDLATLQMRGADSHAAAERLQRNQREQRETRADLASDVAGSGAEFAPPGWLLSEFVGLARPGRVTADLLNAQPLPQGVSSINLPRVKSGTEVDVQSPQGTAVKDTPATTDAVSSGIVTFAGKQTATEQQLFQAPGFDRVLQSDLASAWAQSVNVGVLYGTGANGQLRGLSGIANAVAFTSDTPALTAITGPSLMGSVLKAAANVGRATMKPADAVLMTPERWAWILDQVDSQGRPLVASSGAQFNGAAVSTEPTAEGAAGKLAGLPVYLDPSISMEVAGAAQDELYVIRRDECYLWENPITVRVFDQPYADELVLLFRAHSFGAMIADRRAGAVQAVRGTGLATASLL